MQPIITPLEFAKDRLGLIMWDKFSALFKAVEAGHRRILVRSANGVGKTTALAALCNWKLSTHKECIVLTTSSSEKQVRHNLWGEIRKQASLANLYSAKEITDTRIKLDEKRFMLAVNPAKPESAQGYHAASILIAVDEATGVRRDILSSLIATATGDDVLIVMIYNPMSQDSFVYEAERSGEWKVISIGAFDHPNIKKNENLVPGAVTVSSTEERLAMWSEEVDEHAPGSIEFMGKWWRRSLEVSRRILGQWHEDTGEGLIPLKLITDSMKIRAESGIKTMGVDLSGCGKDETVLARFDGGVQLPFLTVHSDDIEEVAEVIEREYKKGFTTIAIDETSTVGMLTPLLLKRGIRAHSVKFGSKPLGVHNMKHRKLANSRIEMYYNILDELKRGALCLCSDQKLHAELACVRLSDTSERELYYLERKEQVRSRLGRSPDRADATVLARYALLLEKSWKSAKFY